jgi:hypothetical protein
MGIVSRRIVYILIVVMWTFLLVTFIIPTILFLTTGLRWTIVIDFIYYKLFGYES